MRRVIWSVVAFISVIALAYADDVKSVQVRARERIEAERPHKWAVIIGVNNYEDEHIRDLTCAVADARAMYGVLVDPKGGGLDPENVRLITDDATKRPTRNSILSVLTILEASVGREDTVIVYFSGHAIVRDGKPYLLPSDTVLTIAPDTGIELERVQRLRAATGCRAQVVILDACHSGVERNAKGSGGMDRVFEETLFSQAEGMAVISSTGLSESAYEDPEVGRSVFTRYLVEGLSGPADAAPNGNCDGLISVSEASNYATKKVKSWAFQHGRIQNPRLDYNVSGEILLALAPVERTVTAATLRVEGANGAAIFVDGQRMGMAPCEITVNLRPLQQKQVEVSAQKTGYRSASARVTLQQGQASLWQPELERIVTAAILRVEGANGAAIFVDGQERGTAPCEITVDLGPLQTKQVEVSAQKTGYRSATARVTLQWGQASLWQPELERIKMPPPISMYFSPGDTPKEMGWGLNSRYYPGRILLNPCDDAPMVWIPPMGDPVADGPDAVAQGFWLYRDLVSIEQYGRMSSDAGTTPGTQRSALPARVQYALAIQYVQWAGGRLAQKSELSHTLKLLRSLDTDGSAQPLMGLIDLQMEWYQDAYSSSGRIGLPGPQARTPRPFRLVLQ